MEVSTRLTYLFVVAQTLKGRLDHLEKQVAGFGWHAGEGARQPMEIGIKLFAIIFGLLRFSCSAQVSSAEPAHWMSATPVLSGLTSLSGLNLSHNSSQQIRIELLDTNTVHLIAKRAGLTATDLATIELGPSPAVGDVTLYQLRKPDKAFNAMAEYLMVYVQAREEGHTREFMMAALTNSTSPLAFTDLDLGVLALNRPLLPVSWIKKIDSGTRTNKAGQIAGIRTTMQSINGRVTTSTVTNQPAEDQVWRWASYKITDGEIQWIYRLNFTPGGRLDYIEEERRDAKEDEPRYEKTIKDAKAETEAEMKKNGTYGRLGSVHTFWHLLKQRLKAKGIDWRSPAELNPNTRYD
ncbi:MAG: hypothetical protein C5B50_22500 [Verrucomicrobia bacterium]|nr:MAG: hypothetical protein C5B50_22500 [Verrucomicrobiota bacterium]